uniref:Uncharacterized protein n=1 Tax=Cacopsylla melanoneura TaxID=428564 RepID=A0A8D9E8T4_9HEMI
MNGTWYLNVSGGRVLSYPTIQLGTHERTCKDIPPATIQYPHELTCKDVPPGKLSARLFRLNFPPEYFPPLFLISDDTVNIFPTDFGLLGALDDDMKLSGSSPFISTRVFGKAIAECWLLPKNSTFSWISDGRFRRKSTK